jgi:hypothetical protein
MIVFLDSELRKTGVEKLRQNNAAREPVKAWDSRPRGLGART